MKIFNEYTPVSVTKENKGLKFDVINRTYTLDERSIFPSSLVSLDKEILAAPITVHASIGGNECVFSPADTRLMAGGNGECQTAVSAMESDDMAINAVHRVEFDGCDLIDFTVFPRGITPGSLEIFYGKKWNGIFSLDYLFIDVPISKAHVKYYHTYPFGSWYYSHIAGKKQPMVNNTFAVANLIPDGGFEADFKEQIYLHGDEVGVGFFFESDENWNCSNPKKAIEVFEEDDAYILRINFFDCEPRQWLNKGNNDANSRNLVPISLKFGMMVTPIKHNDGTLVYEKNLHLDCMKRFPEPHDVFLASNIVSGIDESGYDRLKRLGVETLYIHEKWNDIQNSYLLTEETSNRLKNIVRECHKRGIRVVPYFGFEISTLSPLFNQYGEKLSGIKQDAENRNGFWYRLPYQRAIPVCMNSEWRNMLLHGLENLINEYGFDGFYFDGTLNPNECTNGAHGCGYNGANGKRRRTFPVFAIREFAKELYKLAFERNAIVNFHAGGCHNLAALGFCSSIFEGEIFQAKMINGETTVMPEGCLRALMDSTCIGVPIQALCYINPPTWTFHEALGMMLLHGSVPKTVCWDEGLEEMNDIWSVYDNFRGKSVSWKPYYHAECPVSTDSELVKVSCYETSDKILAIVATSNKEFDGNVAVTSSGKRIVDAVSGNELSCVGSAIIVLHGFDYKLLIIEK